MDRVDFCNDFMNEIEKMDSFERLYHMFDVLLWGVGWKDRWLKTNIVVEYVERRV